MPIYGGKYVHLAERVGCSGGMKSLLVLLSLVSVGSAQTQTAVQTPIAPETPVAMRWSEREFMMPVRGAPNGIDVLQVEVERRGNIRWRS